MQAIGISILRRCKIQKVFLIIGVLVKLYSEYSNHMGQQNLVWLLLLVYQLVRVDMIAFVTNQDADWSVYIWEQFDSKAKIVIVV